jgi:hypothetical protein
MDLIVETLAEADGLDIETPRLAWPDFPPRPEGWSDVCWGRKSDHPHVAAYNDALDDIRRTRGADNKPPVWKFETNDGWVVSPEECDRIHEAVAKLTRADVRRVLECRADDRRFMVAARRAEDECASLSVRNPELAALVEEVLTAAIAVTNECATETHIQALAAFERLREAGLRESDDAAISTLIAFVPVLLGVADPDPSAVTEDDVTEWLRVCDDFAGYCWRCQSLGGFQVW